MRTFRASKIKKSNNLKNKKKKMKSLNKVLLIGIGVALLAFLFLSGKIVENVDNGEIVVIQGVTGSINIYDTPGPVMQNFGTATHYKKSNQFWFSKDKTEGNEDDQSIKVRFNDGGHAQISGSVRWNMPVDHSAILKIHTDFQSQAAVEQQLIKQTLTKAVYMTGPIMSSQESYAAKRNDLLTYIEDQAQKGVYKTWSHEVKTKDELSGVEKTVTAVTVVEKDGNLVRQETSPLLKYSITINGLALNSIDYDKTVEAQISAQQQATMQVQTAMANSKKAEQDAITTELQGKAAAAKAKWEQEVIKAKNVTEAESGLAVQELATKQAALYKQQQILEGEGDATKQRLIMQANGALDQKLATYERVQAKWADALSKYPGAITPQIVNGGAGSANGGNAFQTFQEVMAMKAQRDLQLDMRTK